jgi:hypothetical protein
MKRIAALLVCAAALAGCGSTEPSPPEKKPPPPAVTRRAAGPGDVLLELLHAARLRDATRAGTFVTAASRRRLHIARLAAEGRQLVGAKIILSERVEWPWAVAAVRRGNHVFAAAVRWERGSWRVELGDAIRLRPILPFPHTVALSADPQIAAEAKAATALIGMGLWLDGLAFSVEARGPRPSYATAFGRVGRDLSPGVHVVVAFARAGAGAVATAWTFSAPEPVS